jgi:NAD(P)H-hydrate epimerase
VGATVFAAEAALTQTIDLVYIIAPESSANIIKQFNPEFIVKKVPGDVLSMEAYDSVLELENKVDSILIGSGSGVLKETADLFNEILENTTKNVVIDADALKIINKELLSDNMVVTPHAYEFEQLFEEKVPKKTEDKIELLSELSQKYSCTILLKGVIDVIVSKEDYKLNRTGNQGMTRGGTGDLLAGLTAALTTKNVPFEAAYLSSFILGCAADKILEEKGLNYTIEDIIKKLKEGLEE